MKQQNKIVLTEQALKLAEEIKNDLQEEEEIRKEDFMLKTQTQQQIEHRAISQWSIKYWSQNNLQDQNLPQISKNESINFFNQKNIQKHNQGSGFDPKKFYLYEVQSHNQQRKLNKMNCFNSHVQVEKQLEQQNHLKTLKNIKDEKYSQLKCLIQEKYKLKQQENEKIFQVNQIDDSNIENKNLSKNQIIQDKKQNPKSSKQNQNKNQS
ncbi:hypothetical protein PPERSA_02307 [Pseudocohnilembus persalinus]|uniref:Uncharacterized protein n=1 Tax=Pseudocohnilembus persalinus TaxID=266149 RepID=A0A0V0QU23_PSEPJ|nr:hypothetical protein PPERSA_02307 [Pseudocohnilembus persalinus]|eukprot:KRX05775.1 hypothetical protein PPERSA_02307 [Pseudocohnilembus persalinus]